MSSLDTMLGQNTIEFLEVTGHDAMALPKDEDGTQDILNMIANMLFRTAESTPSPKNVSATSSNFSKPEYQFIVDLFRDFFGLSEHWVSDRYFAYQLMKHPRARRSSKERQDMNSGFKHFWQELGPGIEATIFYSLDQRLADKKVGKLSEEEQEKIILFANENKNYNWKILQYMGDFWLIDSAAKYEEALNSEAKPYRKIKRNEHSMKFVKNLVHEILRDGKIDPIEKEMAGIFLKERFEGFETLDQSCIDKMYVDISRKDLLFYLALNSRLDGVNVPSKEMSEEVREVREKTNNARKLLSYFGNSEIDSERLALIVQAMSFIGIRGKTNISLMLEGSRYNREDFEKLNLYDVPLLDKYLQNHAFINNCGNPDIELLARHNPRLAIDDIFEENPFETKF